MKIRDGNGTAGTYLDSAARRRTFAHLEKAKLALAPAHGAHVHIDRAAHELGGIVTSEPENSESGNLTSPGEIERDLDVRAEGAAPQAPGANAISAKASSATLQKSALEEKRDRTVVALYRRAAFTKDEKAKKLCESLASKLDSIDLAHTRVLQKMPGGLGGPAPRVKKNFGDRHQDPFHI